MFYIVDRWFENGGWRENRVNLSFKDDPFEELRMMAQWDLPEGVTHHHTGLYRDNVCLAWQIGFMPEERS